MILFTDTKGLRLSLKTSAKKKIKAIIGASIRPQYFQDLKKIADQINVPFFIQPKPNNNEYLKFKKNLKKLNPNLFFINSYSMILREDLLKIPQIGTYNIHPAFLPKNRGSNPIQWSIINQDKFTGVTLHEVDKGIDSGPIIDKKKVRIYFNDTWISISEKIDKYIIELIQNNLNSIINKNYSKSYQNEKKATYNNRRRPNDGLINWTDPTIKIYNLIRALVCPLPGAYYFLDSKKKILDEFITINELIFLKYEQNYESFLLDSVFSLRPIFVRKTDESEDSRNAFSLPKFRIIKNNLNIGILEFKNIDWDKRETKIKIKYDEKKTSTKMGFLIQNFLKSEFNLKVI